MRAPWSVPCALLLLTTSLAGCLFGNEGVQPGGILGGAADSSMGDTNAALSSAGQFRAPIALPCRMDLRATIDDVAFDRDCASSTSQTLEIAGDGRVWVSISCCLERGSQLWTSTDDATTFHAANLGVGPGTLRETIGTRAELAIDEAGNAYLFGSSGIGTQLTKLDKDGNHVHTKPDVIPPIAASPGIRAGSANELYVLYDSGLSTQFLRSFDGGTTWDHSDADAFSGPPKSLGQDAIRDRLFVTGFQLGGGSSGSGEKGALWISDDQGDSWTNAIELPAPIDPPKNLTRQAFQTSMPAVADAAGNIYIASTWESGAGDVRVFLHIYDTNGTVRGPFDVSGPGWHTSPRPAAGHEGHVAIAWYGTNGTMPRGDDPPQAQSWFLQAAYTDRALESESDPPRDTWHTVRADPAPIHPDGWLGSRFEGTLQAEIGPGGKLHIIYRSEGDAHVENRIVVLEDFDLGPGVPRNGPFA